MGRILSALAMFLTWFDTSTILPYAGSGRRRECTRACTVHHQSFAGGDGTSSPWIRSALEKTRGKCGKLYSSATRVRCTHKTGCFINNTRRHRGDTHDRGDLFYEQYFNECTHKYPKTGDNQINYIHSSWIEILYFDIDEFITVIMSETLSIRRGGPS